MKNFKKLAAILLLVSIGTLAFADYSGDLQLRLAGFNVTSLESMTSGGVTMTKKDMLDAGASQSEISHFGYDFGITTYHTWMVVEKYLGIGFAFSYDMAFAPSGNGFLFVDNVLLAPALSSTIGEVVRFELAPGLNIGGISTITDTGTSTCNGIGFGLDFSAIFLPNAVFSPIIAFQFATISGPYTYYAWGSGSSAICEATFSEIKFFIGGAFNFGRD